MCSDAANGEYEDFEVKNEMGCSRGGDATTSESRLHLSDILEMLIRLDQQGIFMNPVDDSFAPDYSKVIKNPMCFLKMRDKVDAEQYTSWTSFVEDFECICYNAMKYNQKRSEIWNAANSMLRQGKRCLEQQSSRHKTILGICKKVQDGMNVQGDELSARVKVEQACEAPQSDGFAEKLGKTHLDEPTNVSSNENLVSNSVEKQAPNTTLLKSAVSEMGVVEVQNTVSDRVSSPSVFPTSQPPFEKILKEDVMVEILELLPGEDIRLNFEDQATDCSSSFGDTSNDLMDHEVEGQSCEVESELRNGNGAKVLTEENAPPSRRKKRAMNPEWKTYRQGIEWRCRWLELRVKELQAESRKYDRILATARSRKKQQLERQLDGSVARTHTMVGYNQNRVLQRRRRRKAEESVDSKSYMSRHPVFSRYEKKQQRSQEELSTEEMIRDEHQQILELDDLNPDFEYEFGDDFLVEEDSMEQYLWHIEALQMHVSKLKNQLTRGTSAHRNSTKSQFRDVASSSPRGSAHLALLGSPRNLNGPSTQLHSPGRLGARSMLGGSKAHGGTSTTRRRNSDFDINNVIMPGNVMANYVEPARHAFIETPNWRLLDYVPAPDGGCSSEEDTDDEAYSRRHVEMQVKERQQQYAPLNKSRNVAFGKGNSKSNAAGKEFAVGTADEEVLEDETDFPTSFGFVPKRKRRRRESRDIASIAKNIEPLLNASHEEAFEGCKQSETMEDGNYYEKMNTD